MKVNKLGISVLSTGVIPIYNYIFNGRVSFNESIYSRRINRIRIGIYIRKYEKLSQ